MSYDGLYFFKMSTTTGAISHLHELTGVNADTYYRFWGTKFISDSVFAGVFSNNNNYYHCIYDFSNNDYYFFEFAYYDSEQYAVSPIINGDKEVIFGGYNYNDGSSTIKVDYDQGMFFGRQFKYDDGTLSALSSLDTSILGLTDFTETFGAIVSVATSVTTLSLTTGDFTYTNDTDAYQTYMTRSYPHDSDIYLTIDIGYVGFSEQLYYNCYAAELGDITYKPVTSTIALSDYSAYTTWMDFDPDSVQLYFMGAILGEYVFTLTVTYESGKWTETKTVYVSVIVPEDNCVGGLSNVGCIIVIACIGAVTIIVGLIITCIIVKSCKRKSIKVNNTSISMDVPIDDNMNIRRQTTENPYRGARSMKF